MDSIFKVFPDLYREEYEKEKIYRSKQKLKSG